MPRFEFVGADQAFLDQEIFKPHRPFFVVRAVEIDVRRQAFDAVAGLIDSPDPRVTKGAIKRHRAAFPWGMEHWLVLLRLNLAEAVHAAHVVNAVHHAASCAFFGKPVPIMQSRVTSAASLSSLQPSVPAGRIGSTMKRVSAVESHTRTSVPAGSVTPKSVNTPRGLLTARERYGADLDQTGGRPSTSHG